MASIRKQKARTWRVQVRRKGRSVSENFVRYEDAKRWAVDAERQIARGAERSPKLGDRTRPHLHGVGRIGGLQKLLGQFAQRLRRRA